MKHILKGVCALSCFGALSLPCMAQSSAWNGSWKSEPSTLRYTGPTFSVSADATGYTETQEGHAEPKTLCDGKPHKDSGGDMTTCTKQGSGYLLESSRNGKHVSTAHITLSADGKTMIRKAEIFPPDGSPSFSVTVVARRISGGPGVSGTWKATRFDDTGGNGVLTIHVHGNEVDFKETDGDKPITCKLDGTPTKFGGMGRTMTVKLADPHTLKVTYRGADGKVQRENTFVLSADGRTIRETDVTPAPAASTMSLVLRKS